MAIRFGQTVQDRFTGQIVGVCVGHAEREDGCQVVIVRPLGHNVQRVVVDEWRLEVRGNLFHRCALACWRFVTSDAGSPDDLRVGLVSSSLVSALAVYLVMVIRCHCQ